MRPIVVDTNCLIQMIPKQSRYRFIWDRFVGGEWNLCVSNEVLEEYFEILSYLANPIVAQGVINVIINSPYTIMVSPCYRFEIISKDRDDNKFVDLAISANADYIVSNDRHFNEVKECDWPHINVINLDEFAIEQRK